MVKILLEITKLVWPDSVLEACRLLGPRPRFEGNRAMAPLKAPQLVRIVYSIGLLHTGKLRSRVLNLTPLPREPSTQRAVGPQRSYGQASTDRDPGISGILGRCLNYTVLTCSFECSNASLEA